jgi:hypothetical protein
VRPAHITTLQELNSARAQGNCQGKNFLIPKASRTKEEATRGGLIGVTATNDTPRVAKSPTQITNISMGIKQCYSSNKEKQAKPGNLQSIALLSIVEH